MCRWTFLQQSCGTNQPRPVAFAARIERCRGGPGRHVHALEGGLGPCLGLIHRRVDRVDAFYSHDHVGKMLSLDTFGQCPLDDDIRVKML